MACYFILMNAVGFFLMGMDKHRAKKGTRRVAELTLFSFAILGGTVGVMLGMYLFHHKTRHWQFRYGLPTLLLAQLALLWFAVYGVSLLT